MTFKIADNVEMMMMMITMIVIRSQEPYNKLEIIGRRNSNIGNYWSWLPINGTLFQGV